MSDSPVVRDATSRRRAADGTPEPAAFALDTTADVERRQRDLWRGMTPLEKVRTVSALTRAVQELSLAGIRHRHPEASERECLLRLAEIKIGRELTERLYPDARALLHS